MKHNTTKEEIALPLVSIIIPAYNASSSIERCLRSILCQTNRDFEVIIIDDGSTDDTLKICNLYSVQDRRVTVLSQKNAGPSSARNSGLRIARGKWIMFVDSDDWIEPDTLENLLNHVNNSCELVMCSGYQHIGSDIIQLSEINFPEFIFDLNDYRTLIQLSCLVSFSRLNIDLPQEILTLRQLMFSPCMKLYLRDCIDFGFDESVNWGEDRLFNFRFCTNILHISFVNMPLYHYMMNECSVCHNISAKEKNFLVYAEQVAPFVKASNWGLNMNRIWSAGLCHNVFELSEMYAAYLHNLKELKKYKQSISRLYNSPIYHEAFESTTAKIFKGKCEAIAFHLIKKKRIEILTFFLHIRRKILKKGWAV